MVWLVDLVDGFKMPLPSKCPMEFACMPEHFVEDVMDLLIFASRIPKALDGIFLVSCFVRTSVPKILLNLFQNDQFASLITFKLIWNSFSAFSYQDDFLNFIIMFMANPSYIKNPYLRAKMVEVLNCWMPHRRYVLTG